MSGLNYMSDHKVKSCPPQTSGGYHVEAFVYFLCMITNIDSLHSHRFSIYTYICMAK